MSERREFTAAAVLCAVGAGSAVVAGGRSWATVRVPDAITPLSQHVTGRELAAVAVALGWAGLAALAALVATRGRVRAAVGGLLVVFGVGIGYASATAVRHAHVLRVAGDKSAMLRLGGEGAVHPTAWWIVSLAGGVLLAVAGALTLARAGRWPGMSARYQRAGAAEASGTPGGAGGRGAEAARGPARADDPSALWRSLDRGEDPTADPAPDGGLRHRRPGET